MKNIAKALNYLSKIYFFLPLMMVTLISFMTLMLVAYYVGLFFEVDFAVFIATSTTGPGAEVKESFQGFFRLISWNFFLSFLAMLIESKILKNLSLFIESKIDKSKSKLKEQKLILRNIAKLILLAYLLTIASELFPIRTDFQNDPFTDFIQSYGKFFLPAFGNAMGLLLAAIIFLYSKNLDEQIMVENELGKLKEESELVI